MHIRVKDKTILHYFETGPSVQDKHVRRQDVVICGSVSQKYVPRQTCTLINTCKHQRKNTHIHTPKPHTHNRSDLYQSRQHTMSSCCLISVLCRVLVRVHTCVCNCCSFLHALWNNRSCRPLVLRHHFLCEKMG